MTKEAGSKQRLQTISADQDGDRSFLLHPTNDDKFIRTGRQIIEACQLKIGVEAWYDNLNSMLEHEELV